MTELSTEDNTLDFEKRLEEERCRVVNDLNFKVRNHIRMARTLLSLAESSQIAVPHLATKRLRELEIHESDEITGILGHYMEMGRHFEIMMEAINANADLKDAWDDFCVILRIYS